MSNERTLDDVADVYIPAPNRPKLVCSPTRVSWKELYNTSIGKHHKGVGHDHRLYSDDVAHITSAQPTKRTVCGRIPQAACADRPMKATTRIRTVDSSAAFHFQPNKSEKLVMRMVI